MAMRQIGGLGHIAPPYTPGIEIVTVAWSNEHGHCYDCGLPAAFFLPEAYRKGGEPPQSPNDTNKRCAICAANAAADGERVERIQDWLEKEDEDEDEDDVDGAPTHQWEVTTPSEVDMTDDDYAARDPDGQG